MVHRNSASVDDNNPAQFSSTMEHIRDKNFVKGIYNRARRTLPHGLTIEPVETHVTRTGVWAQTTFSKGCIFGPYEGPGENMSEEWKDFQSSKTCEDLENQFNERMCNWMIFVNSARNRKETNLEPIFYDGEIFFRTLKSIKKVEQLLVSSDVEIISTSEYTQIAPKMPTTQVKSESTPGLSNEMTSLIPKDEELSFDLSEYLQQNDIELIEKPINYEPRNRTEPVHYKGICPPGKTVRGNEPYMCKQCGARFAHSNALMKHENTHMEDLGRYRCTYCGRVFVQKGSLQKHEEIHTSNQKLAICKVCSVCFESQSDLDEHFRMFHSIGVGRAFPCFICGKGFTKLGSLRAHQRLKHPGKHLHNCRFCMKEFRSKSYLNTHEYQHLSDKPFACQFCSFKFSASSKMMTHIKNRHKEVIESTALSERESLVCYYCGYTFSVHSQFIKHVKLCKVGLSKPKETEAKAQVSGCQFQCRECFKLLPSHDSLESHLAKQHSDRPFKCPQCMRCFRFSCNLQRHVLSHSNLFPNYCNMCKIGFPDAVTFENHQCRKLSSKGKKTVLICPVCRRGFYGRSQHTRHVALCKKGITNKSMEYRMKKQPVYCQHCKKGFHNRKELFLHEPGCAGPTMSDSMSVIRNSLYYGCALCRKAFASCKVLKAHQMKMHPVESKESKPQQIKMNVCLPCKRSFVCLKGLSRHVNHCPALGRTIDSDVNAFSCSTCSKSFKTITLFKGHRVKCKLKNRSRKVLDVTRLAVQHVNKDLSTSEESSDVAGETLMYSCSNCGKKFVRKAGLRKHMHYCHPGPRKCPACFRVFVNRSTFLAHKMVCSLKKRKSLTASIKEGLKTATVKKGPRRFSCTVCGKSFQRIQGLGMHQRSCMPDITSEVDGEGSYDPKFEGGPLSCKICGKSFKKIQGLVTHELTCMPNIAGDKYPPIDSAKPKSKGKYGCKYCQARFDKHYVLGSHVRNCPNRLLQLLNKKIVADVVGGLKKEPGSPAEGSVVMPNDPFICRKCGTSFDDEDKLVEHDYVCCPEYGLKLFSCSKCDTTFSKEIDLLRHEQVHDHKKKVQCGVCGKTFVNNAGLGKHRNTCGSKSTLSMKPVIRKIASTTKIKKKRLKCKGCGNTFSNMATLTKHTKLNRCKIYHNCTLCGKNFQSIDAFDNHAEKCQKVRQHICEICGRGFRVYGCLERHVLNVHGSPMETDGNTHEINEKVIIKEEPKMDNSKSYASPDKSHAALGKPGVCSEASVSSDSQDVDSYSCGRCYKKFPTLEAFADHEEIEHLKKYECGLCLQRFKTERELLLHRNYHVDVYPHKCKMCPFRYKFSAHLIRHFQRKHTRKGQSLIKYSKLSER